MQNFGQSFGVWYTKGICNLGYVYQEIILSQIGSNAVTRQKAPEEFTTKNSLSEHK